jgi:hypothetical protein
MPHFRNNDCKITTRNKRLGGFAIKAPIKTKVPTCAGTGESICKDYFDIDVTFFISFDLRLAALFL